MQAFNKEVQAAASNRSLSGNSTDFPRYLVSLNLIQSLKLSLSQGQPKVCSCSPQARNRNLALPIALCPQLFLVLLQIQMSTKLPLQRAIGLATTAGLDYSCRLG
eukprot:1158818-Pelagomonas_calceolata.AAC.5